MSVTLLFVQDIATSLPGEWTQHFWTAQMLINLYAGIKFKNWFGKQ